MIEMEHLTKRYDGEHCIAAVDGESVCLVKRADLIEGVHAIVLD